jgi:adenylate cyclase
MNATTFERWREREWPFIQLAPVEVKGKKEALTLYRLEWRDPSATV